MESDLNFKVNTKVKFCSFQWSDLLFWFKKIRLTLTFRNDFLHLPLTSIFDVKFMQLYLLQILHVYSPESASMRSSSVMLHLFFFTCPMFLSIGFPSLVHSIVGSGSPLAGHFKMIMLPDGFRTSLLSAFKLVNCGPKPTLVVVTLAFDFLSKVAELTSSSVWKLLSPSGASSISCGSEMIEESFRHCS